VLSGIAEVSDIYTPPSSMLGTTSDPEPLRRRDIAELEIELEAQLYSSNHLDRKDVIELEAQLYSLNHLEKPRPLWTPKHEELLDLLNHPSDGTLKSRPLLTPTRSPSATKSSSGIN